MDAQLLYTNAQKFAGDLGIKIHEVPGHLPTTEAGVSLASLGTVGLWEPAARTVHLDALASVEQRAGALLHEVARATEHAEIPGSHRPFVRGLAVLVTGAVAEQVAAMAVEAATGDAVLAGMLAVRFTPAVQAVVYRLTDWLISAFV